MKKAARRRLLISRLKMPKLGEIHAWLGPSSVGHEANPSEAQDQHRPCRGFGNGSDGGDRVICDDGTVATAVEEGGCGVHGQGSRAIGRRPRGNIEQTSPLNSSADTTG
jgi:hypothetical protein